jgi:hypothetical protein
MKNRYLLSLLIVLPFLQGHSELLSIGSAPHLLDTEQSISLDGGVSFGDAEAYGVRSNIRASERWVWFASIAQSDPGTFDDVGFGGGILVTLPGGGQWVAHAVRVSFHYLTGSDSTSQGRPVDVDVSELTFRYVLSGEFPAVPHLFWFAEAGLHFFQTSVSYPSGFDPGDRYPGFLDGVEPGVEAGLLMELTDQVLLFGSAEYIDEGRLNLGFRYKF